MDTRLAKRADIVPGPLYDAFPRTYYHNGATVTAIEQDKSGAAARTADGRTFEGDIVIGADGFGSVVRTTVAPDKVPEYAGYVAWRGINDSTDLSADFVANRERLYAYVFVKKGQFMAPNDAVQAAAKVAAAGDGGVVLTERGTFFGYGRLVVDFASLPDLQEPGYPVLLDATHSVQKPGALGNRSGGDWTRAPLLLRAGAAAGFDGFFLETHPDPETSPSDGPNMLKLDDLPELLHNVTAIRGAL